MTMTVEWLLEDGWSLEDIKEILQAVAEDEGGD